MRVSIVWKVAVKIVTKVVKDFVSVSESQLTVANDLFTIEPRRLIEPRRSIAFASGVIHRQAGQGEMSVVLQLLGMSSDQPGYLQLVDLAKTRLQARCLTCLFKLFFTDVTVYPKIFGHSLGTNRDRVKAKKEDRHSQVTATC
jgi:hypothetical protein|tara:strand:- start:120 stop:548 length:429 start_codon:yes stop_codon:yes gene_type:complete